MVNPRPVCTPQARSGFHPTGARPLVSYNHQGAWDLELQKVRCDVQRRGDEEGREEEDDQQAQRASKHSEPSRVKSVKSSQVKSRARRDREADKDWASARDR